MSLLFNGSIVNIVLKLYNKSYFWEKMDMLFINKALDQ